MVRKLLTGLILLSLISCKKENSQTVNPVINNDVYLVTYSVTLYPENSNYTLNYYANGLKVNEQINKNFDTTFLANPTYSLYIDCKGLSGTMVCSCASYSTNGTLTNSETDCENYPLMGQVTYSIK